MGLFMAVMIGIGAMMGPGIFALPGELAHMIGPLGVLVYLAMGFLTIFTALNYSELSAAIPLAGGGYSFTSRTLNRPVAFFTGWFFWIGNTLACSMYALIFAMTIRAYFLPEASIALITLITTVVFTTINLRGMKEAIIVITVMNLAELAILVGVAVLGFTDIEPPNLEPFAPMGWGPFVPAMALIYISYVGFELISSAAEEIIEPSKTIPRAILITLGVSTAIYVFVVGVMMGTTNYTELAQSEIPFIFTAERLFGAWGRWAGIIATIMASLSAFSVTLGASARILYALGRDKHFPYIFARLHPKFRTPYIALFICALIVIIFSSSGIVKFVASLSDFGYLMGLGIINYSVIPLHKRMPNLRRPFQTIFFPWIPILGVITTWMFVPALELRSFVLGGILTLVGSGIYLFKSDNRAEVFKLLKVFIKTLKLFIYKIRRMRMRVVIISGEKTGPKYS
jgi:amino acid transporter